MKLTRPLMPLTSVCIFSLMTIAVAAPVVAPVPQGNTPPCTPAMQASIPACPLTGCGDGGDAFLNQAKNRTDVPTVASTTTMTLAQIRAMSQPANWPTGTPRASIQGPGQEGSPVIVKAYLLKARAEGAESCNCGLTKRIDTDIHLVLVSKLPDLDDQDAIDEAEEGSVTAEVTPRVRRNGHASWVHKNINDFEGDYIRITGRLMLDTKHLPPNRKLRRATNWEVHPITRFQVCQTTKAKCDQTIGAPNWKAF